MELTFVRHGETDDNAARVITAAAPGLALNATGRVQCEQLAATLDEAAFTRIYASPLRRTRESAAIIAERLRLPVAYSNDLVEVSVGVLEGRSDAPSIAELSRTLDGWQRGLDLDRRAGGSGESAQDVLARFRAFMFAVEPSGEGPVLVVAHGTFLRLVLALSCENLIALAASPAGLPHLPNAGTVAVRLESGALTCLAWPGLDSRLLPT